MRHLRTCLGAALLLLMGLQAAHADTTLTDLLLDSIERNGGRPAFATRLGKKQWSETTYAEWKADAEKIAAWLIDHGLEAGDRVGILDYNNVEWAKIDLGIQLAGGVSVPFYPTLTGPQHNYILHDTGMKFLFIMDQVHLGPITRLPDIPEGITFVGIFDPQDWAPPSGTKMDEAGLTEPPTAWEPGTLTLPAILAGTEVDAEDRAAMRARVASRTRDDLLTICYTSGTTSAPPEPGQTKVYPGKGVMLSHGNIASNVEGVTEAVSIHASDVFLSVLPLAHMFERTTGYYVATASGARIHYAESPRTFVRDISEVKPTVFACVPLLFERLYNGGFQKASRKLLGKAVKAGMKVGGFFGKDEAHIKSRIVGKLLRHVLGPNVRFAVSGGAALKSELADFFTQYVGITILEGYGLTETSPVLTCNRPDSFRYGTVGVPIPEVEIRLAEDGEILARGPNIMQGYLNMPEKTAEVIDDEGWFHTGDLGGYDPEGRLKITGRKKLLFKLKNGKYISPETIEGALVHEMLSHSMVVGADQDYAAALYFPNLPALREWAGMQGITGTDAELCANETVLGWYQEHTTEALAHLAKFERIKKFRLIPRTLTVEDGELTPTLKLKRGVVGAKYEAEIASLFE